MLRSSRINFLRPIWTGKLLAVWRAIKGGRTVGTGQLAIPLGFGLLLDDAEAAVVAAHVPEAPPRVHNHLPDAGPL